MSFVGVVVVVFVEVVVVVVVAVFLGFGGGDGGCGLSCWRLRFFGDFFLNLPLLFNLSCCIWLRRVFGDVGGVVGDVGGVVAAVAGSLVSVSSLEGVVSVVVQLGGQSRTRGLARGLSPLNIVECVPYLTM